MAGNPIVLGTMLAALAALAFGVTTPFIQRLSSASRSPTRRRSCVALPTTGSTRPASRRC